MHNQWWWLFFKVKDSHKLNSYYLVLEKQVQTLFILHKKRFSEHRILLNDFYVAFTSKAANLYIVIASMTLVEVSVCASSYCPIFL